MSNIINTLWYERAATVMEYFEGKLPAELIQADLDNDDTESLQHHVLLGEAEMSIEHFAPRNEFLEATDAY